MMKNTVNNKHMRCQSPLTDTILRSNLFSLKTLGNDGRKLSIKNTG